MKQKNILFTDMDGTILFSDNGKTYFKESDLDAIKEFQQRGNLIVINSGRALPWIVAPLEGYLLPDYMIAGTGSIIADSHQQILHEEPVSFTAIKKNNKRICIGYTINSSYERQHIFMQSKKSSTACQ
ncbi:MAG: HAD family hydrolase [Suilimivivens sp.]